MRSSERKEKQIIVELIFQSDMKIVILVENNFKKGSVGNRGGG